MTEERTQFGVLVGARRECERRLESGEPLDVVERYIDGLPYATDARAALWLWAWACDDRMGGRPRPRPRRATTSLR